MSFPKASPNRKRIELGLEKENEYRWQEQGQRARALQLKAKAPARHSTTPSNHRSKTNSSCVASLKCFQPINQNSHSLSPATHTTSPPPTTGGANPFNPSTQSNYTPLENSPKIAENSKFDDRGISGCARKMLERGTDARRVMGRRCAGSAAGSELSPLLSGES